VKITQGELGQKRRTKSVVSRRLDQSFAGEAVERVAYRRDTGVQIGREGGGLEPFSRREASFFQLLLERSIDAFEGRSRRHGNVASRWQVRRFRRPLVAGRRRTRQGASPGPAAAHRSRRAVAASRP